MARALVSAIDKIVEFTINCTRVPIPLGATLYGTPVESDLAPATLGLISDPVSSDENYDGVTLNPVGRVTSDSDERRPKQLIKFRNNAIICTFNTRTLGPKGRVEELVLCAKQKCTDVIAVQEHRLYHPDTDLQYQTIDGYTLVTSSCTKNSVNASVVGVGFHLSPRARENLLSIEKTSSRVIILQLEGNPQSTITSYYSPRNNSDKKEVDNFFTTLR